ncbi:hypothetical protein LSH36_512g03070 [Paralvinella palmiformis]|uniref:C2H2-type domain-containing protein n=1 Tax=Paralvinella palmiformis TaxID=53620 RepID=A0AAD9J936_9ANNE|nr:hypothetical protein LSH36_512g03070 [Paralvinella palmiformis]
MDTDVAELDPYYGYDQVRNKFMDAADQVVDDDDQVSVSTVGELVSSSKKAADSTPGRRDHNDNNLRNDISAAAAASSVCSDAGLAVQYKYVDGPMRRRETHPVCKAVAHEDISQDFEQFKLPVVVAGDRLAVADVRNGNWSSSAGSVEARRFSVLRGALRRGTPQLGCQVAVTTNANGMPSDCIPALPIGGKQPKSQRNWGVITKMNAVNDRTGAIPTLQQLRDDCTEPSTEAAEPLRTHTSKSSPVNTAVLSIQNSVTPLDILSSVACAEHQRIISCETATTEQSISKVSQSSPPSAIVNERLAQVISANAISTSSGMLSSRHVSTLPVIHPMHCSDFLATRPVCSTGRSERPANLPPQRPPAYATLVRPPVCMDVTRMGVVQQLDSSNMLHGESCIPAGPPVPCTFVALPTAMTLPITISTPVKRLPSQQCSATTVQGYKVHDTCRDEVPTQQNVQPVLGKSVLHRKRRKRKANRCPVSPGNPVLLPGEHHNGSVTYIEPEISQQGYISSSSDSRTVIGPVTCPPIPGVPLGHGQHCDIPTSMMLMLSGHRPSSNHSSQQHSFVDGLVYNSFTVGSRQSHLKKPPSFSNSLYKDQLSVINNEEVKGQNCALKEKQNPYALSKLIPVEDGNSSYSSSIHQCKALKNTDIMKIGSSSGETNGVTNSESATRDIKTRSDCCIVDNVGEAMPDAKLSAMHESVTTKSMYTSCTRDEIIVSTSNGNHSCRTSEADPIISGDRFRGVESVLRSTREERDNHCSHPESLLATMTPESCNVSGSCSLDQQNAKKKVQPKSVKAKGGVKRRRPNDAVIVCSLCQYTVNYNLEWKRHIKEKHWDLVKSFSCKECFIPFESKADFLKHLSKEHPKMLPFRLLPDKLFSTMIEEYKQFIRKSECDRTNLPTSIQQTQSNLSNTDNELIVDLQQSCPVVMCDQPSSPACIDIEKSMTEERNTSKRKESFPGEVSEKDVRIASPADGQATNDNSVLCEETAKLKSDNFPSEKTAVLEGTSFTSKKTAMLKGTSFSIEKIAVLKATSFPDEKIAVLKGSSLANEETALLRGDSFTGEKAINVKANSFPTDKTVMLKDSCLQCENTAELKWGPFPYEKTAGLKENDLPYKKIDMLKGGHFPSGNNVEVNSDHFPGVNTTKLNEDCHLGEKTIVLNGHSFPVRETGEFKGSAFPDENKAEINGSSSPDDRVGELPNGSLPTDSVADIVLRRTSVQEECTVEASCLLDSEAVWQNDNDNASTKSYALSPDRYISDSELPPSPNEDGAKMEDCGSYCPWPVDDQNELPQASPTVCTGSCSSSIQNQTALPVTGEDKKTAKTTTKHDSSRGQVGKKITTLLAGDFFEVGNGLGKLNIRPGLLDARLHKKKFSRRRQRNISRRGFRFDRTNNGPKKIRRKVKVSLLCDDVDDTTLPDLDLPSSFREMKKEREIMAELSWDSVSKDCIQFKHVNDLNTSVSEPSSPLICHNDLAGLGDPVHPCVWTDTGNLEMDKISINDGTSIMSEGGNVECKSSERGRCTPMDIEQPVLEGEEEHRTVSSFDCRTPPETARHDAERVPFGSRKCFVKLERNVAIEELKAGSVRITPDGRLLDCQDVDVSERTPGSVNPCADEQLSENHVPAVSIQQQSIDSKASSAGNDDIAIEQDFSCDERVCQSSWGCMLCTYSSEDYDTLRQHVQDEHVVRKRYFCPLCSLTSHEYNTIENHILRIHKDVTAVVLSRRCPQEQELVDALCLCLPGELKWKNSKLKLERVAKMSGFVLSNISFYDSKRYTCYVCNKQIRSSALIRKHVAGYWKLVNNAGNESQEVSTDSDVLKELYDRRCRVVPKRQSASSREAYMCLEREKTNRSHSDALSANDSNGKYRKLPPKYIGRPSLKEFTNLHDVTSLESSDSSLFDSTMDTCERPIKQVVEESRSVWTTFERMAEMKYCQSADDSPNSNRPSYPTSISRDNGTDTRERLALHLIKTSPCSASDSGFDNAPGEDNSASVPTENRFTSTALSPSSFASQFLESVNSLDRGAQFGSVKVAVTTPSTADRTLVSLAEKRA